MKPSRWQALTGTLGILAFLGFVGWVVFAGDLTLRPGINIYVEYNRLGIIETGAPVKIGDQQVGFVKGIRYHRPLHNEHPKVRLHLWIDKAYGGWLFQHSRFFLESISIIGQRHINIALPPEGTPLGRPLKNNDVVHGVDPSKLDRVLQQTYATLSLVIKTNEELQPLWKEAREHWRTLRSWEPFWEKELFPGLRTLLHRAKALEPPRGLAHLAPKVNPHLLLLKVAYLDRLIVDFEERIDTFTATLKHNLGHWNVHLIKRRLRTLQDRIGRTKELLLRLKPMVVTIHDLLNSKKGTVGAFMRDKSIWDDLKMMAKRLKNAPLDLLLKRRERTKN